MAAGTTYGSSTAFPEEQTPRRRSGGGIEEWEGVVGAVEVVPGANGIFDVHVDGKLVFTVDARSLSGPDDVAPLLRASSAESSRAHQPRNGAPLNGPTTSEVIQPP
jgi:hypothetical protein